MTGRVGRCAAAALQGLRWRNDSFAMVILSFSQFKGNARQRQSEEEEG